SGNDFRWHRSLGPNFKVIARPLGLCAPVFIGRYLYLAHGIVFGSETHGNCIFFSGKGRVLYGADKWALVTFLVQNLYPRKLLFPWSVSFHTTEMERFSD